MNHYEIGNHIYNLRVARGLTQRDVASKLAISDKAISKWENGTSQPSVDNLQKLADIFDITLDELLKISKENQEKQITKIVITGGLLSGKTTCCHEAKKHFEKKGYKVVIVPSMELILKNNGFADFNNYEELLRSRLQFEKMFDELIQAIDAKKILVLYDGASLDIKSMCTKREFTTICNALDISPEKVRNSYDAIFHLKSIAKWDTEFFESLNDNKNIDTSLAINLDDKIIDAWIAHANYRMIDCNVSIENKTKKLIHEIAKFLNEDERFYIEKKYLINIPDISYLDKLGGCSKVKMTLTYLNGSSEQCDVKLLLRDEDGKKFYQKITKGNNKKSTISLSAEEYIDELDNKMPDRNPIIKYRYSFIYHSVYYKIDIFEDKDFSILEVDLLNSHETVHFPSFIEVLKDISDDPNYKNYNLSKK